ncbi:MAG: hypothetical protein EHM61_24455 [Acidobacteria bacterium]|nr:MAG: hypothetical protein EHM61_24455 [Acidobacteriota bacterium]
MTPGENLRCAARFEGPEWIPMIFHINPACWQRYPAAALQDLMAEHRLLFPRCDREPPARPVFSPVQKKDCPIVTRGDVSGPPRWTASPDV